MSARPVAVIGGGPAGLMAATMLSERGHQVTVLDGMPTVGRKFLLAGRGGLNLTHSETLPDFIGRYGAAAGFIEPMLGEFSPDALRAWCAELGVETFVGSSGRVFPTGLKASGLLRAWLRHLVGHGVRILPRHRWQGWTEAGALRFERPAGGGEVEILDLAPDATVLALGGASWPRLGADGGWVPLLAARGIAINPLRPANCGLSIAWSAHFLSQAEGQPLKRIILRVDGQNAVGELVLTRHGIEGGAVYALTAQVRDALDRQGQAVLWLDLKPDLTEAEIARRLNRPRRGDSLSNHLRKALRLDKPAIALLRERVPDLPNLDPASLAGVVKRLALPVTGLFGLERAISTAGGIRLDAVDDRLMLTALPGVFVAGEMLDWEAPTGGYLLQAAFSTGRRAALGAAAWLQQSAAA
ncbi:MAG TPA: TIGR03862 family flavoprotein [Stellaceae bacterium]|nr:TIGR03862 family flavoprotein [Stellaceae bacterium]